MRPNWSRNVKHRYRLLENQFTKCIFANVILGDVAKLDKRLEIYYFGIDYIFLLNKEKKYLPQPINDNNNECSNDDNN